MLEELKKGWVGCVVVQLQSRCDNRKRCEEGRKEGKKGGSRAQGGRSGERKQGGKETRGGVKSGQRERVVKEKEEKEKRKK